MWYWYLFTFAIGFIIGLITLGILGGGVRSDYDSEVFRLQYLLRKNGIEPGPGYMDGSDATK